jgi:Amt family ammonium transporter
MRAVAREHAVSLRNEPVEIVDQPERLPAGSVLGRKILVAEDNEVNQIVVVELLRKIGHQCLVVDNGRKAVEAAMTGEFDLVVMDCQMPEMDGFEATRIIRQNEAARGSVTHIPIIALTANAIKGDREQCLAAGMDGYCSKPVDVRTLLAQIELLLHGTSPQIATETMEPVRVDSAMPAIIVDTLVERCMNNPAIVEVVMQKFEKQARGAVAQLRQELAANDLASATRTAHSLKGAAGIVAADGLTRIAAEIEQLGRKEQAGEIEKQLSRLAGEIQRCVDYLPQVRAMASSKQSVQTMGN